MKAKRTHCWWPGWKRAGKSYRKRGKGRWSELKEPVRRDVYRSRGGREELIKGGWSFEKQSNTPTSAAIVTRTANFENYNYKINRKPSVYIILITNWLYNDRKIFIPILIFPPRRALPLLHPRESLSIFQNFLLIFISRFKLLNAT